jgi:transglutaminase-like putative cysteine protease
MKSIIRISATILSIGITAMCILNVRANDRLLEEQGTANESGGNVARTFRFTYEAAITELDPGTTARVWVPVASNNADQDVEVTSVETPSEAKRTKERRFGNQLLYFEAKANEHGEIPMRIEYKVTRRALSPKGSPDDSLKPEEFLTSSEKVPVDGTVLKRLFSDGPPSGATLKVARALYDQVDLHMKYDKSGEGWGRGDALWACDSRRGNCSDFHSVFIALCRDLDIPAKFEIGFPLPPEKGKGEIAGYHCWAKFVDNDHWVGVDISEADKQPEKKDFFFGNLPADRIMLSTERDLVLEPRQTAGPVNFLIYPYAEVAGKVYAKQRRKFSFEDLQ